MRPSTEQVLLAALQAAVLAACSDGRSTPSTPPVSSSEGPTRTGPVEIVTTAVPTTSSGATATPLTPVENTSSTRLEWGQRCMGAIVRGLKPATPVDAIELRLEYFTPTHRVLRAGKVGEPCSGAKDKPACLDAFERARPAQGGEWLVYSRGDEARAVSGAEVKAWLAPIETPEEAAASLVFEAAVGASGAAILTTCDPAAYHAVQGGFEVVHESRTICDESSRVTLLIDREGSVRETHREHTPAREGCHPPHVGRRPEGFVESSRCPEYLGQYLAWCAELEAASVPAFDRLEVELRRLKAPRTLLLRARAAQRDEVRHAAVMTRLAHRHGGSPQPAEPTSWEPRDADLVAIDNAVEGCVLELFGALMAMWQSQYACDEEIRSCMEVIARDEARHGALAIDIARWFCPRLSSDTCERIRAAQKTTLALLRAEAEPTPRNILRREAGLPDPGETSRLIDGLERIVDSLMKC